MITRVQRAELKTNIGEGVVYITASIVYEVPATFALEIAKKMLQCKNEDLSRLQSPDVLLPIMHNHASEKERSAVAALLGLACAQAREKLDNA